MTSRERVVRALGREQPDMVPLSIGSTSNDCFTRKAMKDFAGYAGIEGYSETVTWKATQTVKTPERVLDMYHADFRQVAFMPGDNPSEQKTFEDGSYVDAMGVLMRPSAYYFDPVERPLAGPVTRQDVESYALPSPYDPGLTRGLRQEVERLALGTDYAIVCDFLTFGPFEAAIWVRGWEDFLSDLYTDPGMAKLLMGRFLEYALGIWDQMLSTVGDLLHVVCQGDDLAMQDRSLISPDIYRTCVKPFHKELYAFIRSKTPAKIMHHSCGSAYELIPDLIDCGVEVLNPVQTSARNMEPERLKREFGSELSFWGGLDIQKTLSQGTPEEVETQVKRLMDVLGTGGGYVFAPSHNIQPDVPMINIKTMFEAANRYR